MNKKVVKANIEEPILVLDDEVKTEEPVIEEAPVVEEIVIPEVNTMEDDVIVEIKSNKFEIGDAVQLIPGAKFAAGGAIAKNLFDTKLYVRQIIDNNYAIGIQPTGRIAGTIKAEALIPYSETVVVKSESGIEPYLILVKTDNLDIKSRPVESSKTLKTIHFNGLYTIVDEKDGWGHMKIGGWIPLDKVKKIEIK